MKIGLFSKVDRNIITAFADGVLALGYSPVWQNPTAFKAQQLEKFDFVAIWGGAGPRSREVINTYKKFDIKSLVFEGGYVGENTHSISIGQHYWMPDFDCPSDRMNKFGLKLTKEQKEDGYILVLGQSAEINSLLAERVRHLKTDRKIVFRPHPGVNFSLNGINNIAGSLDEALAGAYCVMCHTSNSANQALLKGIPVFCSEQNMASGIANTNLDIENPVIISDAKLINYFSRLCYAVWTEGEIKNGKALEFYMAVIEGNPPVKKGVTKSVQDLKGKFKGQTAYIIGKGPSLKYLSKEDFTEGGLVIPLNEAIKIAENISLPSTFTIMSQQKDGKPECMVQPENAPLLLHEQESKDWFPEHPERYIFDIEKDYNVKQCPSVVAAIEFAKLTGCNKIVFMCFDSYTDDIDDYPDDSRLGKLHSVKWRIEHLKAQKLTIPEHTKDIETEFIKPEKRKKEFTVITLTGDRPKAFKLCKQYMERQTVQPTQWIVVSDGKRAMPKKDRNGCEYYRRKPLKTDPIHTLRVNLLEALKHVKTDSVVIVEDDDWYSPNYLETSLKYLEKYDLTGQNQTVYWNVKSLTYKVIRTGKEPDERSSMCLTAFNRPVFSHLKNICGNKTLPEDAKKRVDRGFVDLILWRTYKGKKSTYNEPNNLCVGIKGLCGRPGLSSGHTSAIEKEYINDSDGAFLKSVIGEDVKHYIKGK